MNEPSNNLNIWEAVESTDFEATKQFNRGGGFKGTAINPIYQARKATELWGPMGEGWGIEILKDEIVPGFTHQTESGPVPEQIHRVLVRLWYVPDGYDWGEVDKNVYPSVTQYGSTTFVGKNKYGGFTDEEAFKKSLTDAMTKCLSLLGFSADVFTGKWDDNKYVNDRQKESEQRAIEQEKDREFDPQKARTTCIDLLAKRYEGDVDRATQAVDEFIENVGEPKRNDFSHLYRAIEAGEWDHWGKPDPITQDADDSAESK